MVRTTPSTASAPAATKTSAPKVVKAPTEVAKKAKVPKNTVVTEAVPEVKELSEVAVSEEVVESEDTIAMKMAAFNCLLQQVVTLAAALKVSFKTLDKLVAKEVKACKKASSKKSKRSGNRQPSGFVRPTLISQELATFLDKPDGTEMARTAVSKEINLYIRSNNLQDKDNGRQINADAKLSTLLKLAPGDVLTYFNLQRYMKHHFVKVTPPVVATA